MTTVWRLDATAEPMTAGPDATVTVRVFDAEPCSRCHHQYRHHAVTEDGYRCRACKCKRGYWR